MFSGELARLESPSLRVPTHGCRTRPPEQATVSANACSARNASLQPAGSLSHQVLGALLPRALRAPTQSVAEIHTNRPCSGTCTLAEACTGVPHCNLPGHPDRCGKRLAGRASWEKRSQGMPSNLSCVLRELPRLQRSGKLLASNKHLQGRAEESGNNPV